MLVTDGTVDFLRQKYPSLKIIQSVKNYGLHKGFNVGVRCSKGEIVIGVDQDCVLMDDQVITKLLNILTRTKSLGIIAFNVKNYYSKKNAWDDPSVFIKEGESGKGYPRLAYNGFWFCFLKGCI